MKILMYHYIKDKKKDKFKNLKALNIKEFENQLKILKKNFNVLAPAEIKYIITNKLKFSNKDFWLTFDDGYLDHYNNVFPLLEKYKFKGSFFPSVNILKQKELMDVNIIQLVFSKKINIDDIFNEIDNLAANENLKLENYLKKISNNHRFDNLKTNQIKQLLQYILPKQIRIKLINILYRKYIKTKKKDLHKKFYMNLNQLKELKNNGHEIGMHGFSHFRLNQLSNADLKKEIFQTINYWKKKQIIEDKFTFCYPFGEYNKNTIQLLKRTECLIGLTTKPSSVKLNSYSPLEMPRYDTNDFSELVN